MPDRRSSRPASSLVEKIYQRLKSDLYDFLLLPGDRFTETELSQQMQASRTPVREALVRLEREGYLTMRPKAGWMVKPFDFQQFEELYDLRIILEVASLKKLAGLDSLAQVLRDLAPFWQAPEWERSRLSQTVFEADEAFHHQLVQAAGNRQITQLHWELTERIRIVRRLDFTDQDRIRTTYVEHGLILQALRAQQAAEAARLLEAHIVSSRAAVKTITWQRLEMARSLRYETS